MKTSIIPITLTAVAIALLYTNLPVALAGAGEGPPLLAALVPALLGAAVAHQVVLRGRGVVVDRTLAVITAFLAILLVSAFPAVGKEVALARIWTFLGEGVLIYFLVRNSVRTLPELRGAMIVLLGAACLLSALTVIQAVTGSYDQDFGGLAQRSLEHLEQRRAANPSEMGLEDRARGPVGDPNRFAQILLMAAPLSLVLAMNARRWRGTAVFGASLTLILGAVLLTYSRGAFVTLVLMVIVAAPLRVARPATIAMTLLIGVLLTPLVVPGYVERVGSIGGTAGLVGKGQVEPDGPIRGRATEMLAALAAYVDHPVLGVGPGQYMPYHSVRYQALPEISIRELPTPRRAHSLYLEVAAETGTLGLALFLAIPLLLLKDLDRIRRRLVEPRPDLARVSAGFTLLLLAYLGTGVFLHLAFERYYWLAIGLTAAAVSILERAPRTAGATTHGHPRRGGALRELASGP